MGEGISTPRLWRRCRVRETVSDRYNNLISYRQQSLLLACCLRLTPPHRQSMQLRHIHLKYSIQSDLHVLVKCQRSLCSTLMKIQIDLTFYHKVWPRAVFLKHKMLPRLFFSGHEIQHALTRKYDTICILSKISGAM